MGLDLGKKLIGWELGWEMGFIVPLQDSLDSNNLNNGVKTNRNREKLRQCTEEMLGKVAFNQFSTYLHTDLETVEKVFVSKIN